MFSSRIVFQVLSVIVVISLTSFYFVLDDPIFDVSFKQNGPISDVLLKYFNILDTGNHNGDLIDFRLEYNGSFYVYNDIDWMSIKCDGKEVTHLLQRGIKGSAWMKHSDDYWFYKHALEHPLRTRRPEEASLFVVGSLLNLIVEQVSWSGMKCCIDSVCNLKLIPQVEHMLLNSKWFQRSNGSDHVIVASHYASNGSLRSFKAIKSCNWISFEDNKPTHTGRMRVASTYVGNKCPATSKTYDIAFIGSMHPERKTFQDRGNACKWLMHQQPAPHNWTIASCGTGQQCPALAQARMGLHIRGDSFGSNRLIDTLLSDTVPVCTAQRQYEIIPSIFPWRKMSVFIPLDSKDLFFQGIAKSNISAVAEFNRVYNISARVDWRNNYLFEQYMAIFSKTSPSRLASSQ